MDIKKVVSDLRSELARLDRAIAALESLSQPAPRRGRPPKAEVAAPSKKRRMMNAAARKRISEAMKQRWAKWKGKSAPRKAEGTPRKTIRRRPMSAAARKKLSAMMKARWEERKKAKAA